MKTRSLLVLLGFVLSLVLSGCSASPATPDAAAAAAQKFLQARVAGNAGAMYGLLTEAAGEAMTVTDISRFIRYETFSFGALGAPVTVAENWVQVPVSDYRIASAGQETTWPEFRLTMVYEGERWRIGWTEPLVAQARQAYVNSQFGEELALARAIGQIDPYSYRSALERHFAFRGLKRLREAEVELLRARELASRYEAPDVEDAFARFKLSLNQPGDAATLARGALEKAGPLVPGLYSHRWQADTLAVLGRALLAQGDRAGAEDAVKRAEAVDPGNGWAEVLRRSLLAGS
ncbi:MAG: hypothetical protein K0R39_1889 [Symbiobacteriaceae bacterium]|jgi:hypothetical protein|nr:hypothetical protein [Symbiobacteriaceae bacterium]